MGHITEMMEMVVTELFIQTFLCYTPRVLGGICHSFYILDSGPII